MAAYATRRDLFRYGLARGALANPGRSLASVEADTDVLELDGHGFETDDAVTVRAAEGGTLAAPLVAGNVYYVIRLTDSTFQLSETEGGAEINLTTDGDDMFVAVDLPIDDVLEVYSRFVDGFIPHIAPLEAPYPIEVTAVVAELAARKLQLISGQSSESMKETEIAAKAKLERWAKGIPIRDTNATASANLAVTSSADSSGWGPRTLP